ncbi:hypothetical protein W911_12080 [Hyphomicrobium nitrativorans NL23]|uniref:Uncharacterized protein n=1 Tax=Hyphomicrobium nitrativorans NL23 TaxID=1029756 RepID=V5SH80_9HYPH|nr:hypothetical protein [Hyphomicrobium nitrativorans]AHB50246.1 hypothetical protein W911_12080 [Hyphomicrobium nitrativorans NL23]
MAATEPQPHGNFIAFLVREKEPGDKRPMFEGRLSLPDEPKVEYAFPLFGHEYTDPKTGEVMTMFNGSTDPVSLNAAPMDQIAALLKGADTTTALASVGSLQLRPRQLVLFPNRFKDEAPEKDRPHYWGAYNHTRNDAVLRIGAWLRKDRYGRAMFGGATSYPLPGKSEVEQQDATLTIAELEAQGVVSRGMPEKAKKRSGGRGE